MKRTVVVLLAVMFTPMSACDPGHESAPAATSGPSPPASMMVPVSTKPTGPDPLPSGFPAPRGAVVVPLPGGDPGLIGLWSSDLPGSSAYDFYVRALPAAEYPIVDTYPGGAAALIRFSVPSGAIWQVVMRAGPHETVLIEVRLDRP